MPAPRLLAAVGLVLLVTVAAAFSGKSSSARAPLPGCAGHGSRVATPQAIPRSFPVPNGTVLTSSRQLRGGLVIAQGIQPIGIQGATLFLFRELPRAGYRLGRHDAEAGEAETFFVGHGVAGRIKVRAIVGCYGATQLMIRVAR